MLYLVRSTYSRSHRHSKVWVNMLLAISVSLMVPALQAQQSSTIIGGESFASDCYHRSQSAAVSRSASRLDIEVCDRAVLDGGLVKSKLAASYTNRGVIYMAMEDLTKAYKDYEKALKIDGTLAEAYLNRGNLWFAVQKFENAISDYDKALHYGTSKVEIAFLNRGLARENIGELVLAKNDYQSSLTARPEWQPALDKLERVNGKLMKSK